jgi:adenylosuccinate lyase
MSGDEARFVHQGMTSSDVLDTTLNIQLVRAADLLLAGMDRVLAALKARAFEHKDTVRIGRSHGIHAEPTTMGLTFARFYAEMARGRARLVARGPRWQPAPFPALSAPSPISTRRSRRMSARNLA